MKLYNGAPCSKLRAHMDAMSELRKELNLKATMLVEKGASVTYFPVSYTHLTLPTILLV